MGKSDGGAQIWALKEGVVSYYKTTKTTVFRNKGNLPKNDHVP